MERLSKFDQNVPTYGDYKSIQHEKIILTGEPFTDEEFPPENSSLIHHEELKESKVGESTKKIWKEQIEWKRISEIYPESEIYKEEITTSDVAGGIFHESYLLSSMYRIAQDSGMAIKKLFINKDINTAGIYSLKIFIDGCPKTVTIDDYIPYISTSNQPAFIHTSSKSVWALLVEKAWAKVCGSYEKAHSKTPYDFFSFVTPYAVKIMDNDQVGEDRKDFFWANLNVSYKNGYWMNTESIESSKVEAKGIYPLKTFTVKGTFEDEKQQTKLVLLDGHTNKDSWRGEWKDTSDNWTDDLKQVAKFETKHTGEFYVSYEEYLKYFSKTYLGLYTPELEMISHLPISQPLGSYTIVKLNAVETSEIAFKITQPFGLPASPVRFIINKDITNNDSVPERYYYVDGRYFQNDRISYLEVAEKFQKGVYYLFIEVDDVATDLSLSLFSSTIVQAKTVSLEEHPGFLEEIIACYMTLKESQYRCSKDEPEIQIKYYNGMKLGGYLAHYYTNESPNGTVYQENFKYSNPESFEFLFPYDKEKETIPVKVLPGEKILKIFKKKDISAAANISYNNSFVASDEFLEKNCKENGKSKPIMKNAEEESLCRVALLQHDAGYVFYFSNNEPELYLDAYLGLSSLTNIEPEGAFTSSITQDKCWHFILKPGEERFFHLRRKDFGYKFGLSHKSSYKLISPSEEPRDFK